MADETPLPKTLLERVVLRRTITVRMRADTYLALQRFAKKEGVSMNTLIAAVLDHYTKEHRNG